MPTPHPKNKHTTIDGYVTLDENLYQLNQRTHNIEIDHLYDFIIIFILSELVRI